MLFIIDESEAGERLDIALAALADVSRSQRGAGSTQTGSRVDGRACPASRRVQLGEVLDATPPDPVPAQCLARADSAERVV